MAQRNLHGDETEMFPLAIGGSEASAWLEELETKTEETAYFQITVHNTLPNPVENLVFM